MNNFYGYFFLLLKASFNTYVVDSYKYVCNFNIVKRFLKEHKRGNGLKAG